MEDPEESGSGLKGVEEDQEESGKELTSEEPRTKEKLSEESESTTRKESRSDEKLSPTQSSLDVKGSKRKQRSRKFYYLLRILKRSPEEKSSTLQSPSPGDGDGRNETRANEKKIVTKRQKRKKDPRTYVEDNENKRDSFEDKENIGEERSWRFEEDQDVHDKTFAIEEEHGTSKSVNKNRQNGSVEEIESETVTNDILAKDEDSKTVNTNAEKKPTFVDWRIRACQAKYSWEPEYDGDIRLRRGEIFKVLKIDARGFWDLENSEGERGVAPMSHLRVIDPEDIRLQKMKDFYDGWAETAYDNDGKWDCVNGKCDCRARTRVPVWVPLGWVRDQTLKQKLGMMEPHDYYNRDQDLAVNPNAYHDLKYGTDPSNVNRTDVSPRKSSFRSSRISFLGSFSKKSLRFSEKEEKNLKARLVDLAAAAKSSTKNASKRPSSPVKPRNAVKRPQPAPQRNAGYAQGGRKRLATALFQRALREEENRRNVPLRFRQRMNEENLNAAGTVGSDETSEDRKGTGVPRRRSDREAVKRGRQEKMNVEEDGDDRDVLTPERERSPDERLIRLARKWRDSKGIIAPADANYSNRKSSKISRLAFWERLRPESDAASHNLSQNSAPSLTETSYRDKTDGKGR